MINLVDIDCVDLGECEISVKTSVLLNSIRNNVKDNSRFQIRYVSKDNG